MKLKLIYFYPKELNLYGDRGNIEILFNRAKERDIDTEVLEIGVDNKLDMSIFNNPCIVFMGGGPDSGQKTMYEDLLKIKSPFIKEYVEKGGAALFICGAYQLIGQYYKSADGTVIKGMSLLDFYTEQPSNRKSRCVGNIICKLNKNILSDPTFKKINSIGENVVGFENHGGRTYFSNEVCPFAQVTFGYGNNGEDKTEGIYYKNTIGTYLHGPVLSKNPHIADLLIAKALKLDDLKPLNDDIIKKAHSALLKKFK